MVMSDTDGLNQWRVLVIPESLNEVSFVDPINRSFY